MYEKAIVGKIKNVTGILHPHEEPEKPEVIVETDKETPEESARKIIEKINRLGYI